MVDENENKDFEETIENDETDSDNKIIEIDTKQVFQTINTSSKFFSIWKAEKNYTLKSNFYQKQLEEFDLSNEAIKKNNLSAKNITNQWFKLYIPAITLELLHEKNKIIRTYNIMKPPMIPPFSIIINKNFRKKQYQEIKNLLNNELINIWELTFQIYSAKKIVKSSEQAKHLESDIITTIFTFFHQEISDKINDRKVPFIPKFITEKLMYSESEKRTVETILQNFTETLITYFEELK